MAYHEPGTEPVGNRPFLRGLRILTSDQRAAQLVRFVIVGPLKYLLLSLGIALAAIEIDGLHSFWPNGVTVSGSGRQAAIIEITLIVMIIIGLYGFMRYLLRKWQNHIKYRESDLRQFFWTSGDDGAPPPGATGILFNRNLNKWSFHPAPTLEDGLRRGINFKGLKLLPFLGMEFTVGVEYPLTAFSQIIKHYFGSRKWNTPVPDRKTFYTGIINNTLAAYICTDKNDPDYGHCVFRNAMLPFFQHTTRLYSRIILHLDHDSMELSKLTMEYAACDGGAVVEVWGSTAPGENTRNDLPLEKHILAAGQLCLSISALYAHGHAHMWANGTCIIPGPVWPLAERSSTITQWMNSQAIFLSWWFASVTEQDMASLLLTNYNNGLPFHSHGEIMSRVAERSDFHKMTTGTRKRLIQHLKDTFHDDVVAHHADSILAATTIHSADHYFAARYFPKDGNVVILNSDLSGLFLSLISPIKYWFRRTLVRQHLDDPICRIIYEEAMAIDPEFANNALSIGCAY